jgi:hypothetical protein
MCNARYVFSEWFFMMYAKVYLRWREEILKDSGTAVGLQVQ